GDVRAMLANGLLNRPELPIAEARAALESPDPRVAPLAAHLLGRAGARAADAGPAVAKALAKWRAVWDEQRPSFDPDSRDGDSRADTLTACVRDLVWAAGRLGVARDALAEAAAAR